MLTTTGEECMWGDCGNLGFFEYRGYCPSCWLRLSEGQRAALLHPEDAAAADGPPPAVVQTTVMHPPVPKWVTLAVGVAGGIVGAAGVALVRAWLGW
jgi:hypothetical protein